MGLLDDAIREHLELKKRSGASEDEIRRLEAEALTNPRPPATEEPVAVVEDLPEARDVRPDEAPSAGAEPVLPPARQPDPPVHAPEPAVAPASSPDPVLADEADWLEDPDEVPAAESLAAPPVPPVREPAPRPHGRPTVEQETHEFTPEDIFADDDHVEPDDEPAEDVLEETPEFLQETPEHDRLWFEQKPPRDFDFGG